MNHITFRPWLLDNYIDLIYRTKKRKIKVSKCMRISKS